MTEDIKPIRNYPFRGKIYTAKQIDKLIESGGSFDPTLYYTKNATDELLDDKQDVLTAGSNVQISEQNVISATDTTYTAGSGIAISEQNVISATGGAGSDWTVVTSTDWRTNIISIQAGTNTVTFLKDCCLCILQSVEICGTVFIPKGSKFSKYTAINFGNKATAATVNNELTYVSHMICNASIDDVFSSSNTFNFKYGTIKVNADGTTNITGKTMTITKQTFIANVEGAYLLIK